MKDSKEQESIVVDSPAKASEKKAAKLPELSNKQKVFDAWTAGEIDPVKLRAVVKDSVKLQTVRGWTNRWKNAKGLPKGIKG